MVKNYSLGWELDTLKATAEYWGATNPPPTIHLSMSEAAKAEWRNGYLDDPAFKTIAADPKFSYDNYSPGRQFFVNNDGMIFFSNKDYQPRLCVPGSQRNFILKEAHENALESAHSGPEHLWQSLSTRFYWKRMKIDIEKFCKTCDVCQKSKFTNFNKFGLYWGQAERRSHKSSAES